MKLVLATVALVAGAAAVEPIGAALSKPITGGVVPTRLQDLAGYLSQASSNAALPAGQAGPLLPTAAQADQLKELAALSLAGGLVAGVLAYVLLVKVLG